MFLTIPTKACAAGSSSESGDPVGPTGTLASLPLDEFQLRSLWGTVPSADRQSSEPTANQTRKLADEAILQQLEKICLSQPFVKSRRLIQFLRYITAHALEGRADELKEYSIAVDVFERAASYDPRVDTIVRTEARRLRTKLRSYYEGDGASDPIEIDVPKGSYIPQFRHRAASEAAQTGSPQGTSEPPVRDSNRLMFVAACLLLAAAGWFWLRTDQVQQIRQPVLTRVTTDSGLNVWPALSGDGKLVAYSSDRSGDGNLDLYVQQVGGTADPLRLTSHESDDHQAHFSPNGRSIVFRSERDRGGIYTIPTLGGPERLVAAAGHRPKFSPNGEQIAFHTVWPGKIFVVAANGGGRRQIESSFASAQMPVWSPDGRLLLFEGQSTSEEDSFDWWATPVAGGPAIRTGIVDALRDNDIYVGWDWASPSVWTDDPDVVVASARQGESRSLWRFPVSAKTGLMNGPLRRIGSGVGHEAQPSMAHNGAMAFAGLKSKVDVWTLPIDADSVTVQGPPSRLSDNVADDIHPHVDQEGETVVFVSRRSGERDIRIVNLRDSSDTALTDDPASEERVKVAGDGTTVVFTREEVDGRMALYRVPSTGGTPEEICAECGHVTSVSSDAAMVIYNVGPAFESRWFLLDIATGSSTRLFPEGLPTIYSPAFSPDDSRIAFEVWESAGSGRIAIAELHGGLAAPPSQWLNLSAEQHEIAAPQWSPDGNVIYYLSRQDGFTCVWARRLDHESRAPIGESFSVHHFHQARFAPFHKAYVGFSVARDKLVLSMEEKTGEIWLAQ